MSRYNNATADQQIIMARGGSEHKEEVRARVIRIRQETYDRLKNSPFAGFGMDFDDVVTKSLDRLDELERLYQQKERKGKGND